MNTWKCRCVMVATLIVATFATFNTKSSFGQNGHMSELVHVTDSLYQIALDVSPLEQGEYLINYRYHIDSLRTQHLALNDEVMGNAKASLRMAGGPITLMNDAQFSNMSRASKVATDHYYASLVVLDRLWALWQSNTSHSILREEDNILVSSSVKRIERIQDQMQGRWLPYEESHFRDSETVSKEKYEYLMEQTTNVIRNSDYFEEMAERLEAERLLLAGLLD